jgi:DNA-binding NtrC family response regulator
MSGAATTVHVLALLPTREDQASLNEIFRHSNWTLHFVEALGQARAMIDELAPGVVISDCRLHDGCWQDVLCELQRRKLEPPLIVASRLADERLWGEVLNLGGYDVLATPFQAQEVVRSVSLAWRYWREKFRNGAWAPAKVTVPSASGGLTKARVLSAR